MDLTVPSTFDFSSIGAGSVVLGHENDCATYTVSNGIIHIPCVNIGAESYWVDLEIMPTNPISFLLKR